MSKNHIQDVISDDLFPNVQNVADVKQVLGFMEGVSQPLRAEQVRAILFLHELGENKIMHPDGNPYKSLIDAIKKDFRKLVADPEFYIDTIESLVPKPPRPILMTQNGEFKKLQQAK